MRSEKKQSYLLYFVSIILFTLFIIAFVVISKKADGEVYNIDSIKNSNSIHTGDVIVINKDYGNIFLDDNCIAYNLKYSMIYLVPEKYNNGIVSESHADTKGTQQGWTLRFRLPVEDETEDDLQSELPTGTITCVNMQEQDDVWDLKAFSPNETSSVNQSILANAYIQELHGKNAEIIMMKDVYPRRNLSANESGNHCMMYWKNIGLPSKTCVYAVVYTEADGVYYLQSNVNDEGGLVFEDFILRDASTISLITIAGN